MAADCAGEMPSKANEDSPRAVEISGSVRTIMRQRPGAGLHGVVLGSSVWLSCASRRR
jgi:hypothetical protein